MSAAKASENEEQKIVAEIMFFSCFVCVCMRIVRYRWQCTSLMTSTGDTSKRQHCTARHRSWKAKIKNTSKYGKRATIETMLQLRGEKSHSIEHREDVSGKEYWQYFIFRTSKNCTWKYLLPMIRAHLFVPFILTFTLSFSLVSFVSCYSDSVLVLLTFDIRHFPASTEQSDLEHSCKWIYWNQNHFRIVQNGNEHIYSVMNKQDVQYTIHTYCCSYSVCCRHITIVQASNKQIQKYIINRTNKDITKQSMPLQSEFNFDLSRRNWPQF